MVENAEAKFTLNKRIKDDKFNVELIARYDLMLQVEKDKFRVSIVDSEDERCLYFDDYRFGQLSDSNELIQQLEIIYDDHHLLKAAFWRNIKLCFKNFEFSLIPEPLFEASNSINYLSLNTSSEIKEEDISTYSIKTANAVSVFPAERRIIEFFKRSYPGKEVRVIHDTASFIQGILNTSAGNQGEKHLFLNVNSTYFTAVVTDGQDLEYCNNFYFSSTEDFVYFVMFVFNQLNLDPDSTNIKIWGEITPDSPVFSKLYQYIRNIDFGGKPRALKFSYHFDEVMDHRFFDVYSLYFC